MIIDIIQTKTNFDMEWQALKGQTMLAIAKAPFVKGKFQVRIDYFDEHVQDLYYNPSDTTWGAKLVDRLSFKLFENNTVVGKLVGRTKKTGFLKAFAYYEFQYDNNVYYGYEVGFGSKGLYLCIYQEEELIAIVDKKLRVVNYRDVYTAYMLNDEDLKVVVPFVVYYDSVAYGDVMEVAVLSVKEKRVNTIQKELIEKYDSSFIELIKERDGLIE